ncbi:MAG: TdeIII family type II restriction endonuclease [Candidatus Promineofilum sp.]|nr:TdeIII family type II restriction endonuclease [Promineifilum sp.]
MKAITRQTVHNLLKTFTQTSLQDYDIEKLKRAYPFHRLFFDDAGLVAFKRERSIVTKMGMRLYPEIARLIALENYSDVAREKVIQGELDEAAVNAIDRIVRDLRAAKRQPDHELEWLEIRGTATTSVNVPVRVIADLYIGDFQGGPFFAEIKTPVPNLDICAESKSKILTFESLLHEQHARGFLAFAYNPYVTRADYAHGFTKRVMDLEAEVLMGEEFWDVIGGNGTFSQLLTIIDSVGNQIQEELAGK